MAAHLLSNRIIVYYYRATCGGPKCCSTSSSTCMRSRHLARTMKSPKSKASGDVSRRSRQTHGTRRNCHGVTVGMAHLAWCIVGNILDISKAKLVVDLPSVDLTNPLNSNISFLTN